MGPLAASSAAVREHQWLTALMPITHLHGIKAGYCRIFEPLGVQNGMAGHYCPQLAFIDPKSAVQDKLSMLTPWLGAAPVPRILWLTCTCYLCAGLHG